MKFVDNVTAAAIIGAKDIKVSLMGLETMAFRRAEMAIIVALLHDVIDDTYVGYDEVISIFGEEIAKMVQKVSELSSLNQLLRRNRRHRWESGTVVRLQLNSPCHMFMYRTLQLPARLSSAHSIVQIFL